MTKWLLCAVLGLLFAACDGVLVLDDEQGTSVGKGSATLRINVDTYDFLPFDGRATTVKEVSSHLSFGLFFMNGEKVMATQSQKAEASDYGTLNVKLDPGRYILVTVAHNGTGNCTISSPTEVKFNNNKVTDTFTSCDTINVERGDQQANISLVRRVAMVRLILEDELPEEATQMKFYYTGGSSTLDASTGFGSVNSRQTVIEEIPESAYGRRGTTFDLYTFPHEERDSLKLTISTLSSAGTTVTERSITNLPVRVRQITQYRGNLGGSMPGMQFDFNVASTAWITTEYTF